MESYKITKIKGDNKEIIEDTVAEEVPLTLIIGDKELVTLLCSPFDLKDLVRGFLFTSGLIKQKEDIKKITIDQEQWIAYIDLTDNNLADDLIFKRLYTSGCGKGVLFYNSLDIINRTKINSNLTIETKKIKPFVQEFQKMSQIYLKTGGVHSAAITDEKKILIFKEDIGRHNAIDKVIGNFILNSSSFENKIILSSGRISSEIIFKIQKCRIPILVSQSAPTNQAIKLAQETGITLVGFARGIRMNIYTQQQRIKN